MDMTPTAASLSRAKAICDREVAAGKLSADWYRRDELERLIAGHAEAQARDDERAVKAESERKRAA